LIVFRALQITKNQKQIIEHQKEIVEEKHKEIQDSINYAKRIQDAIMPSLEDMQMALKNGFILYQPKDVVAGDFFWMEKINNVVYFAAADCTGHGVPGAMVSVVCSNALTKALLEEGIRETGKLLDRTRELVIERFAKSGDEVKDGMDISLCALNVETNELQWSGANNPLWIIRNNTIYHSSTKIRKR
jgi:serine phosphatase RsbU (regulator of sigma subunit)